MVGEKVSQRQAKEVRIRRGDGGCLGPDGASYFLCEYVPTPNGYISGKCGGATRQIAQ
jgi:hypothetical protein